jgi:hypothetical protein
VVLKSTEILSHNTKKGGARFVTENNLKRMRINYSWAKLEASAQAASGYNNRRKTLSRATCLDTTFVRKTCHAAT